MPGDTRLRRYAELAVRVGANMERGQLVTVTAHVEHAPLVREIADVAYAEGARFVDVQYHDPHVRRSMIVHAPEESLAWTPPWALTRLETHGAERSAGISLTGDPDPRLLDDVDGDRARLAHPREAQALNRRLINERTNNWTVLAAPNEGWARAVFGEPDVERLWGAVATAVRLDEPDPVAAWHDHLGRLEARAAQLDELRLDAVRFRGPGTDLTVGLLPESRWYGGWDLTAWGRRFAGNVPTEEVYSAPDRRRTEGSVRMTRPLVLRGALVEGAELRFERGRVVEVRATRGRDALVAEIHADEAARYLGEIALVDGSSRVGRLGLTFFDALFDENATCHLACGFAYDVCAPELEGRPDEEKLARGLNVSITHTDFMVGGRDVDVDGVRGGGGVVPLIHGDVWQLGG
jgi:aminopeptidase